MKEEIVPDERPNRLEKKTEMNFRVKDHVPTECNFFKNSDRQLSINK